MRAVFISSILAVTILAAVDAYSAPTGPIAPVAPAPVKAPPPPVVAATPGNKIVVRPRIAWKQGESVTKNGQTKTRAEIVAMFDPNTRITAPSGKTLSAQELVDAWDRAEGEEQKNGSSLRRLPKRVWMRPTTEAKIGAQRLAYPKEVQAYALQPKPTLTPKPSVNQCELRGCVPADKEETISWNKQKGDEDIAAAYTAFNAIEKTPDMNNATCQLTWDNGLYLLGDKYSVVKLQIDTKTKSGPSPSQSASASLYLLGQSSPVWTKSGTITNETLDRTFKTSPKSLDYTIVPLVYLRGSVGASATLSAKPTVQTGGTPTQVKCGFDITPRVVANMMAEVKLVVGIPDVATLAEGGIKASLDVVDARFPTQLQIAVNTTPARIDLLFKSDVSTTFMRGNLTGWYKITDLCAFGYCLLEDGFGIDTSGEIILWSDPGFAYNANLVNLSGQVAVQSSSTSVGASQ